MALELSLTGSALLTDDYSAYAQVHVRTESCQAVKLVGHTQAFIH